MERLAKYRFSSFWYLLEPSRRPACLRVEAALTDAGDLADTAEGWGRYADYLAWQATPPRQSSLPTDDNCTSLILTGDL